jgi:hypothetical protein
MGKRKFQDYISDECHRRYSCVHCRAHLANHDELISKSFQGSQGKAYLFNKVINIDCGKAEERILLTGLHAVADIACSNCKTTLGWKYVRDTAIPFDVYRSGLNYNNNRLYCKSQKHYHRAVVMWYNPSSGTTQ